MQSFHKQATSQRTIMGTQKWIQLLYSVFVLMEQCDSSLQRSDHVKAPVCLLWICSSITCDTNTNAITYDTVRCSKQSRKIDIIILLYNKAPLVSLSHCFSQIPGLHEDDDLNGKLCRLCCLDANTEIWTFHQYWIKKRKYSWMPSPLGLAKKNTSSSSTEVLLFKVYYFF